MCEAQALFFSFCGQLPSVPPRSFLDCAIRHPICEGVTRGTDRLSNQVRRSAIAACSLPGRGLSRAKHGSRRRPSARAHVDDPKRGACVKSALPKHPARINIGPSATAKREPTPDRFAPPPPDHLCPPKHLDASTVSSDRRRERTFLFLRLCFLLRVEEPWPFAPPLCSRSQRCSRPRPL